MKGLQRELMVSNILFCLQELMKTDAWVTYAVTGREILTDRVMI